MVGASFALALTGSGLRVALIEGVAPDSNSQPSFDDRTTALGNGSRQVFEALGVWAAMQAEAAPIRAIHVSDAGRFGFARLDAREQGIEAFGFVVPNRVIGRALWAKLATASHVELLVPARPVRVAAAADAVTIEVETAAGRQALTCALAVAADGAQSMLRAASGLASHVEDYDQVAVVVNVAADKPHDGTAFERFTPTGPLAVLPLADGSYTVVWTLKPDRAAQVLALHDAAFLTELMAAFGWRAGRLVRVGKRSSYPLKLTRADETVAMRTVLIGNAAQALHPVAGQGFNLGLRDAATLAEMLSSQQRSAGPHDPGARELLQRFASWRDEDRRGVTRFTDSLVKLFADERPGFGLARNFGLLLFDLAPSAKRALSKVSWGFAGRMPRLVRGLPLE
jgi:2-octaprenyl-6-methoxyphenol hydroxylase